MLTKCYTIHTALNSSWQNAEESCKKYNGHLPSINSDIEYTLLRNIVLGYNETEPGSFPMTFTPLIIFIGLIKTNKVTNN